MIDQIFTLLAIWGGIALAVSVGGFLFLVLQKRKGIKGIREPADFRYVNGNYGAFSHLNLYPSVHFMNEHWAVARYSGGGRAVKFGAHASSCSEYTNSTRAIGS
jgi:hypothetical protein